jgi:hypothetical protein
MDERAELGTQADRLRKRLKQTVTRPPEEWVAPPTAGDRAREVSADLETWSAEEQERSDQTSRSLWDGPQKEKQ